MGPPAAGRSRPLFRFVSRNSANPPAGGFAAWAYRERIPQSGVFREVLRMLQWKPKLIALIVVVVLLAALLAQFTWASFADQFTW